MLLHNVKQKTEYIRICTHFAIVTYVTVYQLVYRDVNLSSLYGHDS
jgi:hypothetical protein